MAEVSRFRRFTTRLGLSWRFFWSQRARWRTTWAAILAAVALLIVVYLALPAAAKSTIHQMLLSAGVFVVSLNLGALLAGAAGLCCIMCLGLIFLRPYRSRGYLAVSPSAIPPVSVYLDAENQLPESAIRPFTKFLIGELKGRRADLLYFLDASQTAKSDRYKLLYRFGFRPVDVPHDPTGEGRVKEAVDREIAMHAYERALLGPKGQEFIIVTGDRDFVPLVYRLVALGHQVRIWASPIREAYRTLETYLDNVHVLDITRTIADLPDLTEGEEILYRVIRNSRKSRNQAASRKGGSNVKLTAFRSALGGDIRSELAGAGYIGATRIDYWIAHLTALEVLRPTGENQLPGDGAKDPIEAARELYAVTLATAGTLKSIASTRSDSIVRMDELAHALAASLDVSTGESANPFASLLREQSPLRGSMHARYLARCARALGLVVFVDTPNNPDIVKVLSDQPTEPVM